MKFILSIIMLPFVIVKGIIFTIIGIVLLLPFGILSVLFNSDFDMDDFAQKASEWMRWSWSIDSSLDWD